MIKKIIYLLFAVLTFSCSNSNNTDIISDIETENPVYLDVNGVTVKAKEWAEIGAVGEVNGIEYSIVDYSTLKSMILWGEDVSKVCTSKITSMGTLFENQFIFNQDVSSWDVSNVTSMDLMFSDAHAFNQDISSWDVSKVTSMGGMFSDAHSFNQDIGSWDVRNVTLMNIMFLRATSFNQDLSPWDVANLTGTRHCQGFSRYTPQWTLPKPNFPNSCN